MKHFLKILFFFFSHPIFSQGEATMVFESIYQGKNLYIQNPFAGSGVGFCVSKVKVNGNFIKDQITSSAFEIDLSKLNLKTGEKLEVIIYHKTDCLPKFLNPQPIHPKCTFNTTFIKVQNDTLFWQTEKEQMKLTFIIEEYRWNKWIKVGTLDGKGFNDKPNQYAFPIQLHNGENKFRVKQIDYAGKPCISTAAKYNSTIIIVTYRIALENQTIYFSKPTQYEIYDQPGNMVKKGSGKFIDCQNLESKGAYYLNYDNICGEEIHFETKKSKKWHK